MVFESSKSQGSHNHLSLAAQGNGLDTARNSSMSYFLKICLEVKTSDFVFQSEFAFSDSYTAQDLTIKLADWTVKVLD